MKETLMDNIFADWCKIERLRDNSVVDNYSVWNFIYLSSDIKDQQKERSVLFDLFKAFD